MAKGLGGGFPISAVSGRAEVMDRIPLGGVGSTYGGNPVSCAAALAVLEVIEEERLADRAETVGRRVMERFERLKEDPALDDRRCPRSWRDDRDRVR
ncbi:MAG: aminotransferase class III-fold pyridoxal phosphate-dependent enzyme [Arhodomonas sp.]|nr:aminotransferase class III-fold pyridoxal phosphate-dependent enzyme [Arhodomonas sp.]